MKSTKISSPHSILSYKKGCVVKGPWNNNKNPKTNFVAHHRLHKHLSDFSFPWTEILETEPFLNIFFQRKFSPVSANIKKHEKCIVKYLKNFPCPISSSTPITNLQLTQVGTKKLKLQIRIQWKLINFPRFDFWFLGQRRWFVGEECASSGNSPI